MKQYEYILLDWDGCLAKTLDIHLDAYKRTFAEYGIYPEDKEITTKVFGEWDGAKKLGITDITSFTQKYLERVHETYPSVGLYDGVMDVLTTLRDKHKKMALLTTSLKETVDPALKHNNLTDMFAVFLSAQDVSHHKPDPEIIFKALDLLHGNTAQAIIIGDTIKDLGAANNAGIDSVLFYPEHNKKFYDFAMFQSYNPTYVISEFKEFLRIIQ